MAAFVVGGRRGRARADLALGGMRRGPIDGHFPFLTGGTHGPTPSERSLGPNGGPDRGRAPAESDGRASPPPFALELRRPEFRPCAEFGPLRQPLGIPVGWQAARPPTSGAERVRPAATSGAIGGLLRELDLTGPRAGRHAPGVGIADPAHPIQPRHAATDGDGRFGGRRPAAPPTRAAPADGTDIMAALGISDRLGTGAGFLDIYTGPSQQGLLTFDGRQIQRRHLAPSAATPISPASPGALRR